MSHEEFKRVARLPDAARQEVLDRLDRRASTEQPTHSQSRHNQRKDTRWAFRHTDVAVTVEHPGGGTSRLLLFSRNLSAGGMSFLHQGFLHPKSRCKVVLTKIDGQGQIVPGLIVSCRHVSGLMHEVGVKFDRRIDPILFVKSPETTATDAPQSTEMPEMHGRVLVIDDSEVDRTLLVHYLKMSGVNLTNVGTSGAALDTVKKQLIEIVLCELNLDGMDGVELIGKLRTEAGFAGPIVVVTAENDEARIAKAKAAGAEFVLTKPYNPSDLMNLMVALHQKIGAVVSQSVLYSGLEEQAEMVPLIRQYIDQARMLARRIEKAVTDDKFADVRQLCLNVKGSATGYGFSPLSDMATEALKILDATQSVRQASSQVRSLCMLCDRLRTRNNIDRQIPNRDSEMIV